MKNQIVDMFNKLTQQLAEQKTHHQKELTHLNKKLKLLFAQQLICSQETVQTSFKQTIEVAHKSENSLKFLKSNCLSEKLFDLSAFIEKWKNLSAFLFKLQIKLEENSDWFSTSHSQFLYIYSLLSEDAATIIHLMFNKDITSLAQLTGFLKTMYKDLN